MDYIFMVSLGLEISFYVLYGQISSQTDIYMAYSVKRKPIKILFK